MDKTFAFKVFIKPPCLECETRSASCHSDCDAYKEYKEKLAEATRLMEKDNFKKMWKRY